jgi:hypothetical protein
MSKDDTKPRSDNNPWQDVDDVETTDVHADEHREAPPNELPEKPTPLSVGADVGGIERYLLPADQTGSVRAKRINVTIGRRTPHKHEWIRVHEEYSAPASILKLKPTNDTFLVAPEFRLELERHLTQVDLRLAVNSQGIPFIWPVRVPFEDRSDDWGYAALEGMDIARSEWVRLEPDTQAQTYIIHTAPFTLVPAWPDEPFEKLLTIAFKRFLIDSAEHPVLRRLRGDVP